MAANLSTPTRLFTVREANATLPLVRAITRDLVSVSRDLIDRRERLSGILAGRRLSTGNLYDEELAQIEEQLDRDATRIQEFIDELQQLGVEVKSAVEGLVDFPAMLDGRLVYLCWKLGEDEVGHWHETDSGYSSRKPLHASGLRHGRSDPRAGSFS